jgi:hypothetical protein
MSKTSGCFLVLATICFVLTGTSTAQDSFGGTQETINTNIKPYLRLNFEVGLSSLKNPQFENTPPALEGFYNELTEGKALTANITFFSKYFVGFGAQYSLFSSNAKTPYNDTLPYRDTLLQIDTLKTFNVMYQDGINIHSIYLTLTGKYQIVPTRIIITADLKYGIMMYNERLKILHDDTLLLDPFEIKAIRGSFAFNGGLEYLLSKNFALGFSAGYMFGRISPDLEDIEKKRVFGRDISLNRFIINAGFKLYFCLESRWKETR